MVIIIFWEILVLSYVWKEMRFIDLVEGIRVEIKFIIVRRNEKIGTYGK